MTSVIIRENRDAHTAGRPHGDPGRLERGVCKSRDTKDRQQPAEAWRRCGTSFPSEPSGETSPANTLISDLQTPALWENKFLWFYAHKFVVLPGRPRKLMWPETHTQGGSWAQLTPAGSKDPSAMKPVYQSVAGAWASVESQCALSRPQFPHL